MLEVRCLYICWLWNARTWSYPTVYFGYIRIRRFFCVIRFCVWSTFADWKSFGWWTCQRSLIRLLVNWLNVFEILKCRNLWSEQIWSKSNWFLLQKKSRKKKNALVLGHIIDYYLSLRAMIGERRQFLFLRFNIYVRFLVFMRFCQLLRSSRILHQSRQSPYIRQKIKEHGESVKKEKSIHNKQERWTKTKQSSHFQHARCDEIECVRVCVMCKETLFFPRTYMLIVHRTSTFSRNNPANDE